MLAIRKVMQEKKKAQRLQGEAEDPFDQLGFGLMAYRKTIWTLVCLFGALSLVVAPVIKVYSAGDGIDTKFVKTSFGEYSLGNLGYSSV